jgi:hypothetical protein
MPKPPPAGEPHGRGRRHRPNGKRARAGAVATTSAPIGGGAMSDVTTGREELARQTRALWRQAREANRVFRRTADLFAVMADRAVDYETLARADAAAWRAEAIVEEAGRRFGVPGE